jgi:hypothetical protein
VCDTQKINAGSRVRLPRGKWSLTPSFVSSVCRYAFANPGQFSTAYRRRFGETLSDTATQGLYR